MAPQHHSLYIHRRRQLKSHIYIISYRSGDYKDELVRAAAWLSRATNDSTYLRRNHYTTNSASETGTAPSTGITRSPAYRSHTWNNLHLQRHWQTSKVTRINIYYCHRIKISFCQCWVTVLQTWTDKQVLHNSNHSENETGSPGEQRCQTAIHTTIINVAPYNN